MTLDSVVKQQAIAIRELQAKVEALEEVNQELANAAANMDKLCNRVLIPLTRKEIEMGVEADNYGY